MNKIYPIILLLLITLGAKAQEQVIKTSPLGYVYGRYNLQYERMLTDYTSVNISASYLKPNLFGMETIVNTLLGVEILEDMSLSGVAINADYRLYSQNQDGPRGFYIAPYLRFMDLAYTAKINGDFYQVNANGSVSKVDQIETGISIFRYGFGLKLGAQWMIGDRFSIDWNFGGLGADLFKTVTSAEGLYNSENEGYVTVQEDGIEYTWNYAFSTNFTIGFAF